MPTSGENGMWFVSVWCLDALSDLSVLMCHGNTATVSTVAKMLEPGLTKKRIEGTKSALGVVADAGCVLYDSGALCCVSDLGNTKIMVTVLGSGPRRLLSREHRYS